MTKPIADIIEEKVKATTNPKKILLDFEAFERLQAEEHLPVDPKRGLLMTIYNLPYEVNSNVKDESGVEVI